MRRLPLAPFWKAQRKRARELAEEACLEPNELVYASGVTLEPGAQRALVTFALTREVLVVELGGELTWSLLPLDEELKSGGFLGLNSVRAHPTASPEMCVVEDAHLGGGGMDPCSNVGLVSLKTRKWLLSLTDTKFGEGTVAWRLSPNRRWLAASFFDEDTSRIALRVFDVRDGSTAHELVLPSEDDFYGQSAVAVDDSGTSVAFADERGVRIFDVRTGDVSLEVPDEAVSSLALTSSALLVTGGMAPPRVIERQSKNITSTPEGCLGGSITDVREGRAALVRGAVAIDTVDLTNGAVSTWAPPGAFGHMSRKGGSWLAAHDLDSGRTAVVSKKELVVIEPPR